MQRTTEELHDLVQRGYRFAYALTHNAAQADDLVQDAWLAVLRARGPWTIEYLFKSIRSRFIDFCRREALATFEPLESEAAENMSVVASAGEAPFFNSSSPAVQDALERLRPQERAVLYLAAVENYTAQRIADLLGWPRGTVLSMIHRAREKMRGTLGDRRGATT